MKAQRTRRYTRHLRSQSPRPGRDARFHRDSLGHELRWRNDTIGQAGLAMPSGGTEIVLTTRQAYEPNWLVDSAADAAAAVQAAGGKVVTEPFDIPVGQVTVVADPLAAVLAAASLAARGAASSG